MELSVVVAVLGGIISLIVQTVVISSFISRLASRVEVLERNADELKKERHPDRLLKIEIQQQAMSSQLDHLVMKTDKLLENQEKRIHSLEPLFAALERKGYLKLGEDHHE